MRIASTSPMLLDASLATSTIPLFSPFFWQRCSSAPEIFRHANENVNFETELRNLSFTRRSRREEEWKICTSRRSSTLETSSARGRKRKSVASVRGLGQCSSKLSAECGHFLHEKRPRGATFSFISLKFSKNFRFSGKCGSDRLRFPHFKQRRANE